MPRTIDTTLLPDSVRYGNVTRGEYHQLIPTFSDAAICDHAEVYAQHCATAHLSEIDPSPEAHLHYRVLPELVARLRDGGHAKAIRRASKDSIFRRLLDDEKWAQIDARAEQAIQQQAELAAMNDASLADAAERARQAVHCRWEPRDLVYDGSIYHTLIPELIRRIATRTPALA